MSKINITKQELENIAHLSRISLREEEKEKFLEEIKDILNYTEEVSKIENKKNQISGGENYSKQFENAINKNTIRDDLITNKANEYTESLLENAPEREDAFIKVSQVLDKHKN